MRLVITLLDVGEELGLEELDSLFVCMSELGVVLLTEMLCLSAVQECHASLACVQAVLVSVQARVVEREEEIVVGAVAVATQVRANHHCTGWVTEAL
jgi:hypothetical protein